MAFYDFVVLHVLDVIYGVPIDILKYNDFI